MSHPQRRKKFIDSRVQGALARRIVFHWVLFIGVASIATLLLQFLSNPFRPISEQLQELWWSHGPFLVVLVFLLPIFVYDSIKLSHRFVGPIFSLHRTMRETTADAPPRKLKFRADDFWHELADDFNAMVARLTAGQHGMKKEEDSDREKPVGTAN
jgi:hypothetical protein